jgi:hypothetical protein
MKKTTSRRCAGADCKNDRVGKLVWCERCLDVPLEVQNRWIQAMVAIARVRAIPDAVWDEYLEARATFLNAR